MLKNIQIYNYALHNDKFRLKLIHYKLLSIYTKSKY